MPNNKTHVVYNRSNFELSFHVFVLTLIILKKIDNFIKEVDKQVCVLDVLDTAGQEEFSALREQYMRKGDGFLIVYSVIDPNSCKNIRLFYNQILRVKDRKSYPMILVANKIDLVHLRKISEEEGRELADELKIPYIETSAKTPPKNVDAAFHELVRAIRQQIQYQNPIKKRQKKRRYTNHCSLKAENSS
ncbi:unnamed protein product [Rotaria sp. Silwood1]|nr:unnamed protein product [Rotaria sp. Silwood1]